MSSAATPEQSDRAGHFGCLRLLELIHEAKCSAPPDLGVNRFLLPMAFRLRLDTQGRDYAGRFTHKNLRGECLNRNRQLV